MGKIGTSSPSVSKEVAEVQRLIEKSGLTFHMHSAGTTIGTDFLTSIAPERRVKTNGFCFDLSYRGALGQSADGDWSGPYGAA